MTQEDKQLLLVDLCGRLPYGVICKFTDTFDGCEVNNTLNLEDINELFRHKLDCKPYLRPLSIITEEESAELSNIIGEWFDKELFYLTEEPFLGTLYQELTIPLVQCYLIGLMSIILTTEA